MRFNIQPSPSSHLMSKMCTRSADPTSENGKHRRRSSHRSSSREVGESSLFRMDENAVYWIRKYHSELSRLEPHLCSSSSSSPSLRDSAFLITEHLSEANSTEAAAQYLCVLEQLLLPRPRWHQDDIRLSICWARLYAAVLRKCREKRVTRMEVQIMSRQRRTSDAEENLPSEFLALLNLPDLTASADYARVKEIFGIAMGKMVLHDEFMDTQQKIEAARAVCSMYDMLIDFGVKVHATTTYVKMCKMVKRKLEIWKSVANRAEQEQGISRSPTI